MDERPFIKKKIYIYNEIIYIFKKYEKNLIIEILNKLYTSKYLIDHISIPGWNIFIKKEVINKINQSIIDKTKLRYKQLKILYIFDRLNINIDIIRIILDKIN